MKIVMPGGSGQVGTFLARALHQDGHDVVVLSRRMFDAPWRVVAWDAETVGGWASELEGADAVINLAGRSVNCRYTPHNRRLIKDSRVNSTRAVGQAIAQATHPPKTWLQSSTATIYAHRYDAPNDEKTGILGGDEPGVPKTWRFSIDVAKSWERALEEAQTPRTRKVALRSAITMSPDAGGVFDVLLGFVRAIYWILEHEHLSGPVNLAAPHPLPNAAFMHGLREAWGARIGLPATDWMLEVGTFLMKSETELVLKSRRVVPTRLLRDGFAFQFSTWPEAARDLCARWRQAKTHTTG